MALDNFGHLSFTPNQGTSHWLNRGATIAEASEFLLLGPSINPKYQ